MTETIGKITLDLSKYPGEDFYCDGVVEDELLQITRDCSTVEYGRIIEERKSWPILYHLSPLRENIVDFIPFTKEDKVLEVGSGCGAITGVLSRKAGSVTCVDLSKKRSMINAYRHTECDNVTIHVGNFKDIEPELPADFSYICLIGVFEYGQAYIGGETPYEDFLKILMKHLAPGGRIVIAIENKLGLKLSMTSDVIFDEIRVPDDHMVGAEGSAFIQFMQELDAVRVEGMIYSVGIAQAAVDEAVKYAKVRQTFGKRIIDHEALNFKLADMQIRTDASRALLYQGAQMIKAGLSLGTISSSTKCFVTESTMQTTLDAVQVLGGYGYMKDYPVEKLMRDAKIFCIFDGTNEINRMVIGRLLDKKY